MRARAILPGFTSVAKGAKVIVAGEEVGTVKALRLTAAGLEVTLDLDDERAAWVRSTIPPGSISIDQTIKEG